MHRNFNTEQAVAPGWIAFCRLRAIPLVLAAGRRLVLTQLKDSPPPSALRHDFSVRLPHYAVGCRSRRISVASRK
jgi:hypothetical protein